MGGVYIGFIINQINMPIEIKELQIRAVVSTENNQQENALLKPEDVPKQKKESTKDVTEKALKIPKQKNERQPK